MLITCKCLNVSISDENGRVVKLDIEDLGLSQLEQRDPFFREKLVSATCTHIRLEEAALVEARVLGPWLLHRCLVCHSHTHAMLQQKPHTMLFNEALLTSEEAVAALRSSEQYSPIFNILVREPSEEMSTKRPPSGLAHLGMGNLSKKLTRALQAEEIAIEEAIRVFQEKKYAEYEIIWKKAHRDHKILSSFLPQAENVDPSMVNPKRNILMSASNDTNMSTQTPPMAIAQQPPRANLIPANKPKNISSKNVVNLDSYKEDSLDSEGIFDLEGMDSSMAPHNGHNSDTYDSDNDDSGSRDEGIHIDRDATQPWSSIAKSLPVNMPTFPHFHDLFQDSIDQYGGETQDIAASIKALARSVHGDVLGELPRPRFSTQI